MHSLSINVHQVSSTNRSMTPRTHDKQMRQLHAQEPNGAGKQTEPSHNSGERDID
jgi:hypothetical protein